MTDTKTITLAGVEYLVTTPLTLRQLRDLRVGAALPDLPNAADNIGQTFDRAKNIIVAALKLEHPEIDFDALDSMRISQDEFFGATSAILELAGLTKAAGDQPGEAQAEVA